MKKKIIMYALMIITGLAQSRTAKAKTAIQSPAIESQRLSFSTPIVFDKHSLKGQVEKNPHSKPLKILTKAEHKEIRKKFEGLTRHKDAKELSFEQLRQAADWCLQLGWNEKALFYLQTLLSKTKDALQVEVLKLELADLFYQMGNLTKAEEAFDEYLELYPGSKYAEYAHYKKTICLFYQTLKTDQDQGPTKKAIQLAESYLEKGLAYQQYRNQMSDIRKQCQLMLFEHEKNIFDFYMKRKSYGAANGRLAYLRQQYLEELPHIEPTIVQLECKLAQAQGNNSLYQERLAYLNQKFPEYNKTVKIAQKTSKNYTTQF